MVIAVKKKLIKAGAFLLVVGVFCYCFFVVAPDKDTAALVYNNSYKYMSFSVFDYPEAADGETELKQMQLMEENNQYALIWMKICQILHWLIKKRDGFITQIPAGRIPLCY